MRLQKAFLIGSATLFLNFCSAQTGAVENSGTLIITSGGKTADSLFIKMLGGPDASVIFIPTPASSLRSDSGVIWNPDQEENRMEFRRELMKRFKVNDVVVLHTRDRNVANSEAFVRPLRQAKAVWISGGNPGRFMAAYLGTLFAKELEAFLNRGGILAGESAGAIVQGSYTIRGNPDKPVLMAKGSERGLGILKAVAINPHLSSAKRENELVTIIDTYPDLLGVGIDDDTGFIIQNGIGKVFGKGRVAIYNNTKYKSGWYYWLKPGDEFNFLKRVPVNVTPE
ncbi:Type 1 glutamine amidotransferase-like domain-containing protein [Fulvivirgaceae bacterium PWU4]|uniref:Type 1 glutamine amidotransferase-like domain-containing protein n=1 Tax=Chryseosolibacter histidini TaxID=2782349 RepID=A0AAP2GNP0_9BACT|nr:Type 1 glutamine amidotransferase-like domain-containing protein [Chryseosolibacter histidini]MBT1696712.1 Type 1 glutamine amidotransferase-like domain-containing protein [Chryseosolibacter histidini]